MQFFSDRVAYKAAEYQQEGREMTPQSGRILHDHLERSPRLLPTTTFLLLCLLSKEVSLA